MTDELPPLPDERDPFVLLGVARDIDERELKRAYARKIKIYRPERAPEEFARIHAAFEQVRMVRAMQSHVGPSVVAAQAGAAGPRPDPVAPEEATAPPEPVARRVETRAVFAALGDAIARGDDDASEKTWALARGSGASLEELIVDAPAAQQTWIFEHVLLTWRELSRWRDPHAAFNVWMTAFSACMRAPGRRGWAVTMAEEPALLTDASHEPVAAVLLLNAVSCLAWRDIEAARRIMRALRSPVLHPLVNRLYDRATLDVDVVGRDYHAHNAPPLPPHVLELMADWPILAPPERAELTEKLRTALRDDSAEYLEHLTGTAVRYPGLAEALAHRLLDGVPGHRRDLSKLPPVLMERLRDELGEVGRRTPWVLSLILVLAGAAASVWAMIQTSGPGSGDTPGVVFSVGCGIVGLAMLGIERWWYRRSVRALLARAIARVGVTRAAAREWLGANRARAVRLSRFTPWIMSDDALRLIGMLAGNVADDRELVSDDDAP